MSLWTPALFALFAWWFSTGAILWVVRSADRQGARARRRAVLFGLPFLAAGVAGFWITLWTSDTLSIYVAFVSALAIWGWIELAFLAGVITGPERRPCPENLSGAARFTRAWKTLSHHELLLLGAFLAVWGITMGAPNQIGFWTYAILYVARISAKLNLFFGVPRINTEFVPVPLKHLKSYFRQSGPSPAFPIGVTLLSLSVGFFAERLLTADTQTLAVGFALLTAMALLATLEHWLMVIPLPDAKLWRWMLPAPTTTKGKTHEL